MHKQMRESSTKFPDTFEIALLYEELGELDKLSVQMEENAQELGLLT